MHSKLGFLLGVVVLCAGACSKQDVEARAREAADKIKASIPDVESIALAQHARPIDIKTAQEQLTKLNEYQGEANGTLDSVTVNAIEAFQRAQGLEADGLLTEKVRQLLHDAAAKAPNQG